jgi:hypothetical protein
MTGPDFARLFSAELMRVGAATDFGGDGGLWRRMLAVEWPVATGRRKRTRRS